MFMSHDYTLRSIFWVVGKLSKIFVYVFTLFLTSFLPSRLNEEHGPPTSKSNLKWGSLRNIYPLINNFRCFGQKKT